MTTYAFRLMNVFAESTFGGNPLCVFEDACGMDEGTMQALARQFNLSETTFILPSDVATARVRIFAPSFEMRFAGHPTLGTAHVAREAWQAGDHLTLEFKAGLVPVAADGDGDVWTFTAPHAGKPKTAVSGLSAAQMASLLSLHEDDLLAAPIFVDTGADHLMVPLRSVDAVRRARPAHLPAWPKNSLGRKTAYAFAFDPSRPGQVTSRFFSTTPNDSVMEDPGTGSACANLGGWLIACGHDLPAAYRIEQGEAVNRPCLLRLDVSREGEIRIGGRVLEIGRGSVTV